MRFTTLADTLLVNGVDLQALTGVIVADLDGVHSPGARRGDNDIIPGRPGQLGARKPLDAYNFAVICTVLPVDGAGAVSSTLAGRRAQMLANFRALARLLAGQDGLVTLTRRLTDGGGTIDTTAAAELVDGLALDMLNAETGRVELHFTNLDGCWYAATQATVNPGTVTINGDLPTRRIMLDLPGAGTLTNTTMGVGVQVTTAAVLDVRYYDASAGLATLVHTGDLSWFAVQPGTNAITWSGTGTPDVIYWAAYL